MSKAKATAPGPKVGVYLRQSYAPNGDILAITRQREDVARLCRERGWLDTQEFTDNDFSASNGKRRPDYQRMYTDICDGKINAIVAWDLDRLYREPRELEDLIDRVKDMHLQLVTVTDNVDLSTDNGRMYARMKVAMAKAEVERKSARQVRAARQRAEAGSAWWPTRAFGYTLKDPSLLIGPDGTKKHWANGELKLEPEEAAALRDAYTAVLAGRSLMGIAREWNSRGIKTPKGGTWKGTTLRMTLLNARYAGIRTYRDEEVGRGDWPAIVDEDIYRGAKAILTDPARIRRPHNGYKRRWLLTRIALCGECGKHIGSTVNWKRPSYQCRHCLKVSRQIQPTDDWVVVHIADRLARKDAVDLVIDKQRPDVAGLRDTAQALRTRLDELRAELSQPGIPLAITKASIADTAAKLDETERKMADTHRSRIFDGLIPDNGEREAFYALPLDERRRIVNDTFDALPLDRQRAVVDALVSVTILPGRGPGRRSARTWWSSNRRRDLRNVMDHDRSVAAQRV